MTWKNFLTKENLKKRSIQLIILIAHLILLQWILYTLYEGGVLPLTTVMLHFLGISVYGAVLIRTCAYIYKREFLEEQKKNDAH